MNNNENFTNKNNIGNEQSYNSNNLIQSEESNENIANNDSLMQQESAIKNTSNFSTQMPPRFKETNFNHSRNISALLSIFAMIMFFVIVFVFSPSSYLPYIILIIITYVVLRGTQILSMKQGRTTVSIYTKFQNEKELIDTLNKYLSQLGYKYVNFEGENIFCIPKYNIISSFSRAIKYKIVNNTIIIECWIIKKQKNFQLGSSPFDQYLMADMKKISDYFDH